MFEEIITSLEVIPKEFLIFLGDPKKALLFERERENTTIEETKHFQKIAPLWYLQKNFFFFREIPKYPFYFGVKKINLEEKIHHLEVVPKKFH